MAKRPQIVLGSLFAVVILLAIRVVYLFASYIFKYGNTRRFNVESAALIFVVCAVVLGAFASRRDPGHPQPVGRPPIWLWILCCVLSLASYWPALFIGLLSDDFVLLTRASHWQLGPVGPALFRPLPLLMWAISNQVGGGSITLHLINVLLHGTNGYLAAWVVGEWLPDRRAQLLTTLLFLTAPLAVEAVAWSSGIFDVLATTSILCSVLVSRQYGPDTSLRVRALFLAATLAAVASKETAAIGFLFVLLDAYARKALPRQLLLDTFLGASIIGVFSLVRLSSAFGMKRPPFGKYLVQRAVFGSFGGLAVPWHVEVIAHYPILVASAGAIVVASSTIFVFFNRSRQRLKLALVALGWVLIPVLPVFPIFYIAPDLQASRYLYLAGIGWSMLLAVTASGGARHHVMVSTLMMILVGCQAFGVHQHLQPWIQAGHLRDKVETAGLDLKDSGCNSVTIVGAPDTVSGAYVFRNGLPEAFERDLGLNVTLDPTARICVWQWDNARHTFAPTDRH